MLGVDIKGAIGGPFQANAGYFLAVGQIAALVENRIGRAADCAQHPVLPRQRRRGSQKAHVLKDGSPIHRLILPISIRHNGGIDKTAVISYFYPTSHTLVTLR